MLTVFTPTYNRAYSLPRLYESLKAQTFVDFEWLIVDDGSTDGTKQLIEKWSNEESFIRYYRQERGGKHRAINLGVQQAKGDLFFIVDSDDYLPKDSLQLILDAYQPIKEDGRFAGMAGMRCYPHGERIGGEVTLDVLDTDNVNFREKYKVKGDVADVFKTAVLKEFPFPEFPDELFLTEDVVWDRIARKYLIRFFNRNIYICEYLPDGLSRNLSYHHRNSPQGTMLYYGTSLRDSRFGVARHIKDAIRYWQYTCDYRGKRERLPLWAYLFYPVGWFLRRKDS